MMPILVKNDDVRSGRKAKAHHGRHRSQWVKVCTDYPSVASYWEELAVNHSRDPPLGNNAMNNLQSYLTQIKSKLRLCN